MKFRPCIDIKDGKVVQIVGGSLKDLPSEGSASQNESDLKEKTDHGSCNERDVHGDKSRMVHDETVTNFVSTKDPSYYAELYRRDCLLGGHVIALGPGNEEAAISALRAFPGGLQMGGGITPDNASKFLDAGASHVIVTSFVFSKGIVDMDKLGVLTGRVGKKRLVLDLSCRKRDGEFYIVTDRWQKFTSVMVNRETIERFSEYCDEYLVHGVDVEGKMGGVQSDLVEILGEYSPIPVTYAGGVKLFSDLDHVRKMGSGRVDLTIGSALDIFGGSIPYRDVVEWHNSNRPLKE